MKASLPIGTVVLLKDANKKVMIMGYYAKMDSNTVYDYTGCIWPEGIVSLEKTLVFNHDDIVQVFNNAYVDEEQKQFMEKLNNVVKEYQEKNTQ